MIMQILLSLLIGAMNPAHALATQQMFLDCANISFPSRTFISPLSQNYSHFKEGNRARIERYPSGIYFPQTEYDVINAIRCAQKAGMRVVPRGGGHSYESFSSQDGALVVDMCEMNKITMISREIDDESGIGVATVEGGARLGNVYIELAKYGYNFPGGTCPSVGIGGLIGGGGYGLIARKYGLASDSVLSMRVVLANGTLVTTSSEENPDLFWALRGGNAGSFGIITQYTIQVYKTPQNTMFHISYSVDSFPLLISLFMDHFPTIDRRLTTQLQLNRKEIQFWGQFLGPKSELEQILSQTGVLNGSDFSINRQVFRDDCTLIGIKAFPWTFDCNPKSDYEAVKVPIRLNPNEKEHGKFKADYASVPLSSEGIKVVYNAFLNAPNDNAWIQFETILGSKISDYEVSDSPFVNRKSLFSMQYMTPLSKGEFQNSSNWQWIRKLESDLKPFANGFHYQNYPDLEIGPNYGNRYYGFQNFNRLKNIKAQYDPKDFFRNEQSIPLP